MKILLLCILLSLSIVGCGAFVSDEQIVKAVEKQGYSEVQIESRDYIFYQFRGGGRDDSVLFFVIARNSKGDKVHLLVTSGWPLKGVTIRTK